MKVLVLPRDDNPYQELLYGELRRRGVRVRYLGRLTPSHTLNLLLLPFELTACRLAGARLVHLHWVFAFSLPGGGATRRLAQIWFVVILGVIRLLHLRLVWTAHNTLPHRQVFADDLSARRTLVRRCDLVIAHSSPTFDDLAAINAVPARTVVIPQGPYPAPQLPTPGSAGTGRTFLYFGRIEEYKGVDDLLVAFADMPDGLDVRLVVAGSCGDPALAARLRMLATTSGDRVILNLAHVPDEQIPGMFAAADVVVLPFRKITTSSSALLALSHGRPLVVPAIASLADLPEEAVIRYDGSVPALADVLIKLTEADTAVLETMSAAALTYTRGLSWAEIAATTNTEFRTLLEGFHPAEASPSSPSGLRTKIRGRLGALSQDALFRGSFLLLANTVSLAGFGFLFWTLAAHRYSPSAIGWLAGVTAGVNLLASVAALGLPNTLLRHLTGTHSPRELAKVAVTAVGAVGGAVTLVSLLVLAPLLPGALAITGQADVVVLVTVLVVFTAVSGTLDAGLVAVRATGPLLLKNLAGSILKLTALLLLTGFGVTGLVLAYGSGTILACVLGGVVLWPRLAQGRQQQGPVRLLRRYMAFSARNYLGTIMGILPSTVVPLEVLAMRSAQETAWFAVSFQVAGFLNFIPSTTAQVLFAEAQRVSLRHYLRKALAGVYGLLIPAVAVTMLAAPYILRLFGESYSAEASGCLRMLALSALLTGGNYLVDSILISRDRTGAYIFMNGANAALVLILVALLLPHGLLGAATGWALAQGLSLVLGIGVLIVNFATDADRFRLGLPN